MTGNWQVSIPYFMTGNWQKCCNWRWPGARLWLHLCTIANFSLQLFYTICKLIQQYQWFLWHTVHNVHTSTLASKKRKNRTKNKNNHNNIKLKKKFLSLCSRLFGTFQHHFGNIWENVRWIIHNQTHKAETNGMGFVETIKCQARVQIPFRPTFVRSSSLLHKYSVKKKMQGSHTSKLCFNQQLKYMTFMCRYHICIDLF